ncbi:MAG: phytanoyl-CoA dioxygenase family protein [Alphaproteobacteria bacterium]|nr:phytanoyl-CoA dioxygenase family protein [Alphaproteobacteria bacterium]
MSSTTACRVAEDDIVRFETDGVVCLRNVLDEGWIEQLRAALEEVLAAPGPQAKTYGGDGTGRFGYDTFMWTRNEVFWRLQAESPIPRITAGIMRSSVSHLMADIAFVKEPNTPNTTPWHQDQPYGWYDGRQVCSVWLPLDRVTLASGALEYVVGSHLSGHWYRPVDFADGKDQDTDEFVPMPDIDGERQKYNIIHFDMEPGDLLIHDLLVLHGSPGNSMADRRRRAIAFRYAGDDARYAVRKVGPKPIWDPGIGHGERFGCELFPQVWPHARVPRFWERPRVTA